MSLEISRNFDVALRMLRENPVLFIPSLISLLISTSILALGVGLFFYSTGASVSSLYPALLSNFRFALVLGLVAFSLIVAVSAYFDSISLYMVRQAWSTARVNMDDSFSRGGRYALSLIGVDIFFIALLLLFGAGTFLPLLFAGKSPVLLLLSLFSLVFLLVSFLSFYWRKESVVLKGRAVDALSFSSGFFSANVFGTILVVLFLFLVGFTIEFFGDSLAQVLVAGLKYIRAPDVLSGSIELAILFTSNLLYGVLSRVIKLCVFLDANRRQK